MESMEPVRLEEEINGQRYQLVIKPWPYKVGRRWLARVLAMMAPGLGAAQMEHAVSDILAGLTPQLLEELSDECEAHTDAVPIEGGKATKFADLTPLLRGRYDVTLRVVRAHVTLQFTPFFDSLMNELGGLHREDDTTEEGRSSSTSPPR